MGVHHDGGISSAVLMADTTAGRKRRGTRMDSIQCAAYKTLVIQDFQQGEGVVIVNAFCFMTS